MAEVCRVMDVLGAVSTKLLPWDSLLSAGMRSTALGSVGFLLLVYLVAVFELTCEHRNCILKGSAGQRKAQMGLFQCHPAIADKDVHGEL